MSLVLHDIFEAGQRIGWLQKPVEIWALLAFLAGLQPVNVLEIGTYRGGVTCALSKLCTGRLVTVDLDGYHEVDLKARAEMIQSWRSDVHLIVGDSHQRSTYESVTRLLGSAPVDFLMIDADHSYEGVKADYLTYRPLVRLGGFVCLHDIVDSEKSRSLGCFVSGFWKQLDGDKVEFVADPSDDYEQQWGGLGLIRVS